MKINEKKIWNLSLFQLIRGEESGRIGYGNEYTNDPLKESRNDFQPL